MAVEAGGSLAGKQLYRKGPAPDGHKVEHKPAMQPCS